MKKSFILFLFLGLIFGYGVYHHTNTLVITHHKIHLGKGERKLTIAHVSDLHTKGLNKLEEQVANALQDEEVDIIVITGDIATPGGTVKGYQDILKSLNASKGIFYIPGNWEYWEPIEDLQNILKENNIIDLTNKSLEIDNGLWLIGFDYSEEGKPNLELLSEISAADIKIGLFHSPQFFDLISKHTNLNLAGHSHGGQIRIPFLGSIFLPAGTGKYDQGWFKKNDSQLFVSRGIGTSVLPIRFNCSPELAIIEVNY